MRKRVTRLLLASLIATSLATSITACSKKTDIFETQESQEGQADSTEDKFSLGDVTVAVPKETETFAPEETEVVEVYETFADGTYVGKWQNGKEFVQMLTPGDLGKQHAPTDKVPQQSAETQQIIETEPQETQQTAETTPQETQAPKQYRTDVPEEEIENFIKNKELKLTEVEAICYDNTVSFWITHPDMSEDYLYDILGDKNTFTSLTEAQRQSLIDEVLAKYPHNPAETIAYEDYEF